MDKEGSGASAAPSSWACTRLLGEVLELWVGSRSFLTLLPLTACSPVERPWAHPSGTMNVFDRSINFDALFKFSHISASTQEHLKRVYGSFAICMFVAAAGAYINVVTHLFQVRKGPQVAPPALRHPGEAMPSFHLSFPLPVWAPDWPGRTGADGLAHSHSTQP
ncbi:hypothetical protein Nmel_018905 [Mimus melanotis]